MSISLVNELISQIEIFDALELQAARDYWVMEQELINPELKDTLKRIRLDEERHSRTCREIIEFLKNRTAS